MDGTNARHVRLSMVLVLALVAAVAAVPMALADEPPNLVPNGDFSSGSEFWWGIDDAVFDTGEACMSVPRADFGNFATNELHEGLTYEVGFTARGAGTLGVRVLPDQAPAEEWDLDETVTLSEDAESFSFRITAGPYSDAAPTPSNRIIFVTSEATGTLCLSDVSITPIAELLQNPGFDGLAPWWHTPNIEATEGDGEVCFAVPGGGNQWDAIIGQDPLTVESGRTYTLEVTGYVAGGTSEPTGRALIPFPERDWPPLYFADLHFRADGQSFVQGFEVHLEPEDEPGEFDTEFQIQLGGNAGPFTLCLQTVSLTTGGEVPQFEHETGPRVRVNQVGYLPQGPKHATLVTDAEEPLEWQLIDAADAVVASGTTTPEGFDPSAGLDVHTIDFSGYTGAGEGYRLAADGEESYPFDISASLYDQLRLDALNIYYSQRSGIAIDDDIKPGYGRPAGHVSPFTLAPEPLPPIDADGAPDSANRGDYGVPCLPNERFTWNNAEQRGGFDHYGSDGWDCPDDYALDVTGGWYDAGDHGKYVVNSGISVYQLLSTFERNQTAGVADRDALGDGTLAIPEAGNGLPDILDEVKWNLDWMLKMQVSDGTEMGIGGETIDAGGLAHHKLHDIAWTGLNTLPHQDPMPRFLHRPSTAATLNLAAAAAQGARIYEPYLPDYADELLDAARRAWDAANAHPEIFAPDTNVLDPNPGGGPYNDTNVGDEFYWAAAQLYLTTGEDQYLDAVLGSPYHVGGANEDIWGPGGFGWLFTAAAGRLDLATVPSDLPDRGAVIASVLEGADRYLATQAGEPFGHPYAPPDGQYDWGSAHTVINNAVVIATAYDLSGDERYLDGAIEAIDYLLGRNAINNSYVKGYGTHYSQNMHSRWYRSGADLPPFPDGKLAGGPNSGIQDPVAQANLQGCAPQACYIDHIDSWSTNETTINWNAALAWHASWLSDVGDGAPQWRRAATLEPRTKQQCMDGGWQVWVDPAFRNQGACVASIASQDARSPNAGPKPGRGGGPR
jgi:endoglucanase